MKIVISDIKNCTICKEHLPLGPRPVISANVNSKIVIIGQAPGAKVHASGVPWDDASGKQLRKWLGVSDEIFYNSSNFAIVPMGFCYPGKGKTGDLPPRTECAPKWHTLLLQEMNQVKLVLLIGAYAQKYYLKDKARRTLTETVGEYKQYLPLYFPLPHPSPRNRFWLQKNTWFEKEVVPSLKREVSLVIANI